MNSNGRILNNRGSAMVETAIVFPLVIMTLIAVIFILIHMYNHTCTQSIVDMSSEKSGYYLTGTIESNYLPKAENRLYYSFENNTDELRSMKAYTAWYMERFSLNREKTVDAEYFYHFLCPRVEVSVQMPYDLPFFQKGQRTRNKTINGSYFIHYEAEFIRNMDLIADAAYEGIDNIFEEAAQKSKSIGKK
ncbi:MAG: pilus assembly protein [Clostridiales bacterium]|nr:pilus assembly protein [Clostridiales bacterium]